MPRKYNRVHVLLNVVIESSSGRQQARISDLSIGGCFVDCRPPVEEGELVSFRIEIEDGTWLDFRGEAIYVFPDIGFGVRFLPMPEENRGALEHLILMNGADPWQGD